MVYFQVNSATDQPVLGERTGTCKHYNFSGSLCSLFTGHDRDLADDKCSDGGYDYFGYHVKSVIEYGIQQRQTEAGILRKDAGAEFAAENIGEPPLSPRAVEYSA